MSVSAGQVEIAVMVDGAEKAIADFKSLEARANEIDGRKIKVTADTNIRDLNEQLAQLRRQRFEYKVSFSNALEQSKKLTAQINALQPAINQSAKQMNKFGYSVNHGLMPQFDVLLRNGKEVGLAFDVIKNKGKQMGKGLKDGANRFQLATSKAGNYVHRLKDVAGAANKYYALMEKQTDLAIQRSALGIDWDTYYANLAKYGIAEEGLKAAKDSYQAMGKEADVNNKLSRSMGPVVQKYEAFRASLSQMSDSGALSAINREIERLTHNNQVYASRRAELGLLGDTEEEQYNNKLIANQLGNFQKLNSAQIRLLSGRRDALLEYDKMQKDLERSLVQSGSRMQSLGNAMQRISSPFMGVYRGLLYGVGYRALNMLTTGISEAFSRTDTIKTYTDVLNNLGYNANKKFAVGTGEAQTAIENLNDAVLGLPTGLDEIVTSQKRYLSAAGDIEKATKVAIASNNLFLAQGSDARDQLRGARQLRNMLAGTEMTTQRWASVMESMPMAVNAVGNALGYNGSRIKEFRKDLLAGKISSEDFLNAFIEVGTSGEISRAVDRMKHTYDAVFENWKNAFRRGGETVLNAMDEVLLAHTGKDLIDNLNSVKDAIDGLAASAKDWIKAHPEQIANFLETIQSIDWGGMIRGFASAGVFMGQLGAGFLRLVGNERMVHVMLAVNVVGKVISLLGSFKRGLAGPLSKAMLSGGVLTYLGSWIKGIVGMLPFFKTAAKQGDTVEKGIKVVRATYGGLQKLTWVDLGNKALNIGSIYVVAQALKVLADAMKVFSGIKVDVNLLGGMATAGTFLIGLSKFAVSLGTALSVSKTLALGTAAGTGVIYGISKSAEAIGNAIGRIGEGIKAALEGISMIDTMKLPSTERVNEVFKLIGELTDAFKTDKSSTALGSAIEAWSKGLQADNISKIAGAMESIQKLSEIKISRNAMKRAKKNFQKIQEFSVDIMSLFDDEEQAQMEAAGGTSRSFEKGSHAKRPDSFAQWKEKVKGFAETISALSGSFADMSTMVQGIKDFNKLYNSLGKRVNGRQEFSWETFKERIGTLADNLYELAGNDEEGSFYKLREAAIKLKGTDYTKLTEAFTEIPKMMGEIQNVYNKINELGIFKGGKNKEIDWGAKLKPMFDAIETIDLNMPEDLSAFEGIKKIENALTKVKGLITKLSELSNTDTSGIGLAQLQALAKRVTDGIGKLKAIGNETIQIGVKIKSKVNDGGIVEDIDAIAKGIDDSLAKIKNNYTKNVNVTFWAHLTDFATSTVAAQVATLRRTLSKPVVINKAVQVNLRPSGYGSQEDFRRFHTGGIVQYRANGGVMFHRRGTDTVPAMLTPGEYVLNRRAVKTFGTSLMQKLNHLDIHGALSALSMRAGQGLISATRGIVNNTTNNTKNANVTINARKSMDVSLNRANRFVRAL